MRFATLCSMGTFILLLAALTVAVWASDGFDILVLCSLGVVVLLVIGFVGAVRYRGDESGE